MNFKISLLFLTTLVITQSFGFCPHPNFLKRNLVYGFSGFRADAADAAAEKSTNTYVLYILYI